MTILTLVVTSSLLMAGCDSAESPKVEETRAALVGTWLKESSAESAISHRVMQLNLDGKFKERIPAAESDGHQEMVEYSGEWS